MNIRLLALLMALSGITPSLWAQPVKVLWSARIPNYSTTPAGLAVDGDGNVVAAVNTSNGGPTTEACIVKYSGDTGKPLWEKKIAVPTGFETGANALAVDGKGNVIVTVDLPVFKD